MLPSVLSLLEFTASEPGSEPEPEPGVTILATGLIDLTPRDDKRRPIPITVY